MFTSDSNSYPPEWEVPTIVLNLLKNLVFKHFSSALLFCALLTPAVLAFSAHDLPLPEEVNTNNLMNFSSSSVSCLTSGWDLWNQLSDIFPLNSKLPTCKDGELWVLLVAGSNGWFNYRHQVPILCSSSPTFRSKILIILATRRTSATPTRSCTHMGFQTTTS